MQKIAIREIGDVPIHDVDREREDGETVYDIEAKNNRIEIELEIAADGTLREKDLQRRSLSQNSLYPSKIRFIGTSGR